MERFPQTIAIVIPARNEEKTVGDVVTRCKLYSDEILVVDGHSEDETREIVQALGAKVILDNGKGKGDGIRKALGQVTKEIVVFIDADGSHDPDDVPRLVKPIVDGQADHVTGSRMRGGSDELHGNFGKFIRRIGSDIITLGINYRFGVHLTDSQNGLRAVRMAVVEKLNLKENITSIEQEMIIKTLRNGYRMVEVSTHEYARQAGKSKVNIKKVWFRYVYSWLKYLLFPWT